MNPLEVARRAGRTAYLEGKALSANPYPKTAASHAAWKRGWELQLQDSINSMPIGSPS